LLKNEECPADRNNMPKCPVRSSQKAPSARAK
jgi:hypothetical protein